MEGIGKWAIEACTGRICRCRLQGGGIVWVVVCMREPSWSGLERFALAEPSHPQQHVATNYASWPDTTERGDDAQSDG
jgi:hypothetical protein